MVVKTQNRQWSRIASKALAAGAVAALCIACPQLAHADSTDSTSTRVQTAQTKLSETQTKVQETTEAYNDAVAKVDELKAQQEETQDRIDEINAKLPEQQARSGESAKALYIFQRDSLGLIQAIVSSENMDEFLSTYQYIECINSHNVTEMAKTQSMLDELDEQQEQLEQDTADAEKAVEEADQALSDAQTAREEAQAEAISAAEEQVANSEALAAKEKAAKEAAAAAEEKEEAKDDDSDDEDSEDADDSSDDEDDSDDADESEDDSYEGVDSTNWETEEPESDEVEEVTETVDASDVSWSSDKEAFVDEWAGRIDAYLSGSPMAGQGETFASAAWDYGVDPRWSPAISMVESTKGAYCFMPYNAWGWGDYSFDSWEEAINGHVAYLASMYGSDITYEAACTYCPPNASFWYNRCLEEMNSI